MIEVRIHGRGGQGAVTTGQLIAISAYNNKLYSQSFPNFGVERSGAPVMAFARIDQSPIHLRSHIYNPDYIIILDDSLVDDLNVSRGIKKNTVIIINSQKSPKEFDFNCKVYTVDAMEFALSVSSRPFINTAILGAFAEISQLISLDAINLAISQKFPDKEVANVNYEVVKKVYEGCKKVCKR